MSISSSTFHRLCAAPPAVRTEIFRRALLLGQQRNIFFSPNAQRHLHTFSPSTVWKSPSSLLHTSRIIQRHTSTTASASTSTPPPSSSESTPPPSRTRRILTNTLLFLLLSTIGLTMSAAPAAETVNGYIHPVSDAETLRLYHPSTPEEEKVNSYILNHPLSKRLRADPNISESRPHMRIPPAMRTHNLTAGTLVGPGMLEVPPLNFNDKHVALPTMTQIIYLGEDLCGHPGIVHGGMLATLLDEGLARACFPALPNKVGVTASLKIDYRVPCPAGRYVVLKAQTEKVEGRKAWSRGWIELLGEEDAEGVKLVEAEALFIEPRNAKNMVKNVVASE